MRTRKSQILKKITHLNKSGHALKKPPILSSFKKHSIFFENKEYSISLSELRDKLSILKRNIEKIKEERLETVKFTGKSNLSKLKEKAISFHVEKSKFEILENLILQKELLQSTPNLKNAYSKMINKLFLEADSLFLNGTADKKYLFLSRALKVITQQINLRGADKRRILFGHVSQEIIRDFSKQYN